jgi:putative ABC transport system permease protein
MAGLCLGLLAALALTRLLKTLMYAIGIDDPLTLATGAVLLIVVGFLASYLPARRAIRLNPVDALRSE